MPEISIKLGLKPGITPGVGAQGGVEEQCTTAHDVGDLHLSAIHLFPCQWRQGLEPESSKITEHHCIKISEKRGCLGTSAAEKYAGRWRAVQTE